MARPSRIELPHALYHVTNRGLEHRPIGVDDPDRRSLTLLDTVATALGERYSGVSGAAVSKSVGQATQRVRAERGFAARVRACEAALGPKLKVKT